MYTDIFQCTQCDHSKVNLGTPKLAWNIEVKKIKSILIIFEKVRNVLVSNMLETGAVLTTADVEFQVKYDLPQFLNWVLGKFQCFSFNF